MVVLFARKARQVVHDHEMDLALVRASVLEQLLQLGTIRRLGALAFFLEAVQYLEPFAAAVFLARAELRRQTEVLRLLLRAHADVNHGADHRSQLRPIRGKRQGDRYVVHDRYSCVARCSKNISTITCATASACRRMRSTSSSVRPSASSPRSSRQRALVSALAMSSRVLRLSSMERPTSK